MLVFDRKTLIVEIQNLKQLSCTCSSKEPSEYDLVCGLVLMSTHIEECNIDLSGHRDGITSIDTRGDGRYVLTNSKDQTIKVRLMQNGASLTVLNGTGVI